MSMSVSMPLRHVVVDVAMLVSMPLRLQRTGRCWRSFSGLFTGVAAGEEGEGFGRWSTVAFRGRSVAVGHSRDSVTTGDCMMCSL